MYFGSKLNITRCENEEKIFLHWPGWILQKILLAVPLKKYSQHTGIPIWYTLHTSVIYFPTEHRKPHLSVVGLSETLSHNASTVHAMIKKLLPMIQDEFPELQFIHYLTDSPTSQYRNKTIFQLTCDHDDVFGVKASWEYLEAGHGKGPCDGLGASVKRTADSKIKQEKATIQGGIKYCSEVLFCITERL
jgi:hypothetical protein